MLTAFDICKILDVQFLTNKGVYVLKYEYYDQYRTYIEIKKLLTIPYKIIIIVKQPAQH